MKFKDYRLLIPQLAAKLSLRPIPNDWSGVDPVLPFLERIKSQGCVVLIKFDGERIHEGDNGPYTILITGEALGEEFIRIDAFSLEDGLAYTIVNFARKCWDF